MRSLVTPLQFLLSAPVIPRELPIGDVIWNRDAVIPEAIEAEINFLNALLHCTDER